MSSCHLCGVLATDPGKGSSPWARAVLTGEQILVCPACQHERPEWIETVEACPVCGSRKLSKTLGDRVCRSCGHQWGENEFTLD